jgi:hypothetical protein
METTRNRHNSLTQAHRYVCTLGHTYVHLPCSTQIHPPAWDPFSPESQGRRGGPTGTVGAAKATYTPSQRALVVLLVKQTLLPPLHPTEPGHLCTTTRARWGLHHFLASLCTTPLHCLHSKAHEWSKVCLSPSPYHPERVGIPKGSQKNTKTEEEGSRPDWKLPGEVA